MDEITLTSTEFKALASETRTGIVKLLGNRNYTLSEISKKMNLAAPTIKQHLALLGDAGLTECIDEGRKWKYYSLTKKGHRILEPETTGNIFIVLVLSIIGILAVLYSFIGSGTMNLAAPVKEFAEDRVMETAAAGTPMAVEKGAETMVESLPLVTIILENVPLVVAVLAFGAIAVIVVNRIRKK
ncbi:MAG: hypothetical protein CL943_01125 [Candidatus Diapherotrites archaeon]|uniref:HTH arsR-type domain-containing protein n=1 Tax=Candidatus Iainarchaeum sp. TaxID=3101447 RepID=A0A2D6M0E1_9ARCH|nr:hypothetical protein [Candidatus Diapherotrites archaeon]|tara:strand:+ start:996 stop:1550 length:555 start_codon:yes stop_codon:yes gene_type:complete